MSADCVRFSVPLKIKAKPRPKVTRTGHVYYQDADYAAWRAAVLAEALLASAGQQIEGPVVARIVIFADSFTVELEKLKDCHVYVRADVDNAMGAVFDAVQGKKGERGLIGNDRQVREVHCRVAERGEKP